MGQPLNLTSIGLGMIPPESEFEVPPELWTPGRKANGSRKASPIEMAAPQAQPVDAAWARVWRGIPDPPEPVSRMVTADSLIAAPRAVVEAMQARSADLGEPAPAVEAQKRAPGRPRKVPTV